MPELLIELFSEEIPAGMQHKAAADLRQMVTNALVEAGLTYEGAQAHGGARRLVLSVEGLDARAADVNEERKGPRVDAPQQSIEGFLKSTGLGLGDLKVQDDKKGQFYLAVIRRPGRTATEIIADVVPDTILLMVLSASASYIVVPAVLRHAVPEANPALYFGLSLGITFPLNILAGIPLYAWAAQQVMG